MTPYKKSNSIPVEYEPIDDVKRLQWLAFVRQNKLSKTFPKSSKGSIIDWGSVALEDIIDNKVFIEYEKMAIRLKKKTIAFFYIHGYSMVATNKKLDKCFICLIEPRRATEIRSGVNAHLEVPPPDDRTWGHYANVNCPKKQVNEFGKELLRKYNTVVVKDGEKSRYCQVNPESLFQCHLHDIMGVL